MGERIGFSGGVTLLGASPERSALDLALALAPALVCADGGGDAAPAGRIPDAIIGDLDSLMDVEGWAARLGPRLIRVEEQETTDLEKCLARVSAPFFLGCGFLGGRVDHELAALHALIADPRPIVLLGREDAVFSAGVSLSLDAGAGERISILPMRRVVAGPGAGLKWPVEGMVFESGSRIGSSNLSTGPVRLRFDRPGALVILPRRLLDAALAGLLNRAGEAGEG